MELARMALKTGKHGTGSLTLWEFIETMYLPAIEPPELRRRTVDEYRRNLERYVKAAPIARLKLDRLDSYAAVSWMRGVKERVPHKQTQLHIYRALSAALGRAYDWGLVEENVLTRAVKPPVPDEYVPRVLDEDEANEWLDVFAGHEIEPVVVLAIGCGLRPSEIYGLDWSHLDLSAGTVRVERGMHERSGEVWYEDVKSRTSNRTITIPPWGVEALAPHRRIGPLCGGLKPTQIARRYRKHVLAAGFEWCPLENLRHTSATIGVENGIPIEDMARRLGHSTPAMARKRYVKRQVMRDHAAAAVMEGMRRSRTDSKRGHGAG
jgi:integrase